MVTVATLVSSLNYNLDTSQRSLHGFTAARLACKFPALNFIVSTAVTTVQIRYVNALQPRPAQPIHPTRPIVDAAISKLLFGLSNFQQKHNFSSEFHCVNEILLSDSLVLHLDHFKFKFKLSMQGLCQHLHLTLFQFIVFSCFVAFSGFVRISGYEKKRKTSVNNVLLEKTVMNFAQPMYFGTIENCSEIKDIFMGKNQTKCLSRLLYNIDVSFF